MSSIDKDMQNIASGYDGRVRVRNTSVSKGCGGCNGQIKFYIGNECILSIHDRYGYINESEKAQIRDAILRYKAREKNAEEERRREEARRREEERRREEARRLEEERRREAERVAAYNGVVGAATVAKRSVGLSHSTLVREVQGLQGQTKEIIAALSSAKFEVDGVKARLKELLQAQSDGLKKIEEEYKSKVIEISRFETLPSDKTTEFYRQKGRELSAVSTLLTSATFAQGEIVRASEYVKKLLSLHETLVSKREFFLKNEQKGGYAGEVAKVALEQINAVDKNSAEKIEEVLKRLRDAEKELERSGDEEALLRTIEELRNVQGVSQTTQKIVLRQSSYEHIDYAEQCKEAASDLRRIYDVLTKKSYTTATREELELVEQALQKVSAGMSGKSLLDDLQATTDLLRLVYEDDEGNKEVFEEYARIKEALEGFGLEVELLDVFNYEEQRERLLNKLYETRAAHDLQDKREEAEDRRSLLSLGVRSAFSEQGLYFVSGKVSEMDTAEELVFALPGVDDAVVKALVTERGVHWFVCGTEKADGSVVSAERVLEIMRVFDADQKPQKILNSLSQALDIRQAQITGATDANSQNALVSIAQNGLFSLTEELRTEDGRTVTTGEIMQMISEEFSREAEENRLKYATGVKEGRTQIPKTGKNSLGAVDVDELIKRSRDMRSRDRTFSNKPKQKPKAQPRARYMKK